MRGAGTRSRQPEPGDDRLPGACEHLPPQPHTARRATQGTVLGERVLLAATLLLQVNLFTYTGASCKREFSACVFQTTLLWHFPDFSEGSLVCLQVPLFLLGLSRRPFSSNDPAVVQW